MKKSPAKQKTPQEKKRLSLKRDCRNVYGQTTGASRKGIRRRKRWVNRTYRRATNQVLSRTDRDADDISSEVRAVHRKEWRKCPDMPLGKLLLSDANWTLEYWLWKKTSEDPRFPDQLEAWLADAGLHAKRVGMMMRAVRAVAMDRNSTKFAFDREEANLVQDFLNGGKFRADKK